jgi:hypothetical protein
LAKTSFQTQLTKRKKGPNLCKKEKAQDKRAKHQNGIDQIWQQIWKPAKERVIAAQILVLNARTSSKSTNCTANQRT